MCGIFTLINGPSQAKILETAFKIQSRGPDNSVVMNTKGGTMIFHRLAIVDNSTAGNQPMTHPDNHAIISMCNGEIYNHAELREKYNFNCFSNSDCEIICHMYERFGIEKTVKELDGVFAFILYDGEKDCFFAARDPFGVRPLFIGKDMNDQIVLGSEVKCLSHSLKEVKQFEPGSFWCSKSPEIFTKFESRNYDWESIKDDSEKDCLRAEESIYRLMNRAVEKRLMSDRQIGCFLSGGVDSSIVAALLAKMLAKEGKKLNTYSIGMKGATDLEYARIVADHIGSNHNEVIVTDKEMLAAIPEVVRTLESYDITTVRASTPMYLLSKWIKENTQDVVIFSGEGSDEMSGSYLYFHLAPSDEAFQNECHRLCQDLHYYDVLRCDRAVSTWGLEVRVPFLDMDFVNYYMKIDPSLKRPKDGMEKHLLRKSFARDNLLPDSVLWRKKEAFSDGCSSLEKPWFKIIQDHCSNQNTVNAEAAWYKKLFDENYEGFDNLIPYIWLPKWTSEKDPSARLL